MLSDERAIQILQYIDVVFRQQIDHADKKAATLIAIAAVMLTFNRAFIGIDNPAFVMQLLSLNGMLAMAFVATLAVSICFAFLTIIPRIDSRVQSILFWRSWMSLPDTSGLLEKCRDPNFVRDEFVRDIHLVSTIVEQKMRWLRHAAQLLFIGVGVFMLLILRHTFA